MRKLQTATMIVFVLMLVVYCGVMLYDRMMVDNTAPILSCDSKEITVSVRDDQSALLAGVTATDDRDGDLTEQIMIKSVSRLISANTARVTYIVFDSANNMATLSRTVCYSDYEAPKFVLKQPLYFREGEKLALMDRLSASDVLDGDISGNICVISQNVEDVPGVYTVTVQVTNSLGDAATLPLKLVVGRDTDAQMVQLTDYLVYLQKGADFDALDHIRSVHNAAGVAVGKTDVEIEGNVDTQRSGVYHVCYRYTSQNQSHSVYLTVVVG